MKSKKQLAAVALTLAIATLAIAPLTVAQHSYDHKAAAANQNVPIKPVLRVFRLALD